MKTMFVRRGHVIETLHFIDGIDGSTREVFETNGKPSINKAKKESHRLQMANGGLGIGSLVRG